MKPRTFTVMIVGALLLIFGLGLAASAEEDEVWPLPQIIDCNKYFNHSGHVPGSYDFGIFIEKDYNGERIEITVRTNGQNINVPPPEGRNSWDIVYKCHDPEQPTTTTTLPPDTTTTTEPPGTTTTTQPPSSTTTTEPPSSTTTTEPPPTTSTSTPPVTVPPTTVPDEPELPFTGPENVVLLALAGAALIGVGVATVRSNEE